MMTVDAIVAAVSRWIRMVEDSNGHLPSSADADHSSLLRRLLSEEPVYPFVPPRRYSYPDYRLAAGEAVKIGECWNAQEMLPGAKADTVIVDQSAYVAIERRANGSLLLEWPDEPGSRYEVSIPDAQGFRTMHRVERAVIA